MYADSSGGGRKLQPQRNCGRQGESWVPTATAATVLAMLKWVCRAWEEELHVSQWWRKTFAKYTSGKSLVICASFRDLFIGVELPFCTGMKSASWFCPVGVSFGSLHLCWWNLVGSGLEFWWWSSSTRSSLQSKLQNMLLPRQVSEVPMTVESLRLCSRWGVYACFNYSVLLQLQTPSLSLVVAWAIFRYSWMEQKQTIV